MNVFVGLKFDFPFMINIFENTDLQSLHSLRLKAKAIRLIRFDDPEDIPQLQEYYRINETMFLGKGNNVLFTNDFSGVIIQPELYGKSIEKSADCDLVSVGASEDWDEFVEWSIAQGYCGLENLSLIPGSVGASPIQNIGAYGVEVKDFIHEVEGWNFIKGRFESYSTQECAFAYRDSIFKHHLKDRFLITKVVFRLSRNFNPVLNYGDLSRLRENNPGLSPAVIRKSVIQIRRSKLPDPAEIPNAGSFFKNPAVDEQLAEALKLEFPEMPVYPYENKKVKLAAGWLIEKAGWKGKSKGKVAVHSKQALVLTNPGGGSGKEMLELAKSIQEAVLNQFGVQLEMEVNTY